MDNSYQASNQTDYRYGDTGLDNISDCAQDETIHDTHEEAERIDSDSNLQFEGYFEELGNTTNENYYPFPSKIFALLFFLVYSPHPMVNVHLTHLRYNIIILNTGPQKPLICVVYLKKYGCKNS